MSRMLESTLPERVKLLSDAGMKVSCRGESVRVDEGCLEMKRLYETDQVQFIWYPPDEEVPK